MYHRHAPHRKTTLTQTYSEYGFADGMQYGAPRPPSPPPQPPTSHTSGSGSSSERVRKRKAPLANEDAEPSFTPFESQAEHEQEQIAMPSSPKRARISQSASPGKVLSPGGSRFVSLHQMVEEVMGGGQDDDDEEEPQPDPHCLDDPEDEEMPPTDDPPAPPRPPSPINSIKSVIPELGPVEKPLPRTAIDLGDRYILLGARDRYHKLIRGAAGTTIRKYIERETAQLFEDDYFPTLRRWGRLRLPNGQIARSAWKEVPKGLNKVRMSRNYIDEDLDSEAYGEVQFYFRADFAGQEKAFALISVYSAPDVHLLEQSYNTLWVCKYRGDDALKIIEVKSIRSVIVMVPYDEGRVFAVHKMGLEVGEMVGYMEEDVESKDDEDDNDEPVDAP
ncbi:hypothetical protein MKEN_00741300 [Mycena kentingensis (nom. inval.)]|nr:hypothetical protein MKEN_00741300 [Mycena kentingensis (nom. inval.)]